MNLYFASIYYYNFPSEGQQTTLTTTIEFYANDYNTAMLISSSKAFAMFNNTDNAIYKIEVGIIYTNRNEDINDRQIDNIINSGNNEEPEEPEDPEEPEEPEVT